MQIKKNIVVQILFYGILFYPRCAVAQILNIDSILTVIEKNHPELKMYDAQIKAYNTYATGAKSLDPPQIGAGFFMTPYNIQMWKPDGMTGNNGMGSFMLSAQQMFSNPKKLNANAIYMQGMSNVEREMKNAMRNELFSMAKMSYYEWQVMKMKIEIINASEDLLSYIIKSTEIRYTYGMDKLNAYYKAKAMLGEMQQMRIMTESEISQKRIELNTLMIKNKDLDFDIDTMFLFKKYETEIDDSSTIITNRSDYKALSQNVNLLKSKQAYEYSKRLPDFGVKYDHMFAFGTQPQQFSLMAMMTIPIAPWSSKMYKSSVEALNYDIEAVNNRQQALINNTSGYIRNIQSQIKNKKLQMALYEKTIIPSLRKNYQATLLAYEQNTEELFMALDAWQNYKVGQLGYIDLINDLLQLQVQYEKQLEIR